MKNCVSCKSILPLKFFGSFTRRNKKEYWTSCKDCRYIQIKSRRELYKRDWIAFFKMRYGENPQCAICDCTLEYLCGSLTNSVCFDHRHSGKESIEVGPSSWCYVRPCNEENKLIFINCNFGLLCRHCNTSLPTFNRMLWLQKALKYVDNTQGELHA